MTCCLLGKAINWDYRILQKDDFFTLTPAKGQIGIEGYLLLIHNFHSLGIKTLNEIELNCLEKKITKIRSVLNEKYSKDILLFEHGPSLACSKGGGCLDHTHLHIVPFDHSLLDIIISDLGNGFKIDSYLDLKEISDKNSYLFLEERKQKYVWEIKDIELPSQYLRQNMAYLTENYNLWDWRQNSDWKTFRKTLKNLRNKF